LLDVGLRPRSISFENPTGAPGQGGKAASHLGVGRKGSPSREIDPGQTVQLCDIKGPGTIRHIWVGGSGTPLDNRGIVIRAWWDNQQHPSIECPLGDLMGFAHGKNIPYYSIAHSTDPGGARNIWLPMPFIKRAKIMLTNETPETIDIYYQIDYTVSDKHPADVGRLHVLFRRENPTTLKQDFVLLPRRVGKGRFLGGVVGIRNLHPDRWWGEGEIKIYLDGDTDYPTICGTGSEDWVCQSYGVHEKAWYYSGCSLNREGFVSMYRWHMVDPIIWRDECRVTIQQIAWSDEVEGGLVETSDDWSCATFWYEPVPSRPLPPMPDYNHRTTDIFASEDDYSIKVLSFNIAGDSRDWQARRSACYDVINTLKPDIIGFQELLPVNLKWALDNFPHLSWYGQTIEGNSQSFPTDVEGESCRILYDKNRFAVDTAGSGTFWFSPTPDESSEGWDDFRYCVYVRLVDKETSDGIYLYNTHWTFGSDGQDSRINAARILNDRIAGRAHPEDPFIVTGDFNARSDDAGIQILLQNMTAVVENRIDWIFTENDKYELLNSEIISDIDGTAPSDHDVLSAELKIKN
jgi:endonuclease/exonuclease/phosphatase family metal-dependent hydrolase